jgi:peptidoglycan/LPS O-acetylase OafA/YrhL
MTNSPNLLPAQNNFDVIRLALAFIVFLAHSYDLSQSSDLKPLVSLLSSRVAVEAFFVISGFLIIMSYERSRSLPNYAQKRVRRIYPGYIVSVCFFAILLPLIEDVPAKIYTSFDYFKYLTVNALFLNFISPSIPGVFENNPIYAINGALWTIKIEVMFYVCIPFIAWICRKIHPLAILVLLYLTGFLYSNIIESLGWPVLAKQFPGQLQFFAAGIGLHYFYKKITQFPWHCFIIAIVGFLLHYMGLSNLLYPISLALTIYFLAFCVPTINLSRIGDLSYGVYILHFPILQTLISFGMFEKSGWGGLLLASFFVLSGAFLMWHLVEKRFLFSSSHYLPKNA